MSNFTHGEYLFKITYLSIHDTEVTSTFRHTCNEPGLAAERYGTKGYLMRNVNYYIPPHRIKFIEFEEIRDE